MGYLRFETPAPIDTCYDNTINDFREPEIINLRRVIETYVWRRYCKTVGNLKRLTKRKSKYYFLINWDDLKFNHSTHMTKVEEEYEGPLNLATGGLLQKQLHNKGDRHSYKSLDVVAPHVINSAQIENHSEQDNIWLFSTDKDTKVNLIVEFNTCYALDKETNIELTVPASFVSPTNHVDCRLSLKYPFSERLKETVIWAVDAEIPVKSGHKVNAILSAQEQHTCAEFDVETVVSLDNPWLTVNIHRKHDNSVAYTCLITDLHEVFRRHQNPNLCLTSVCDSHSNVCKDITLLSSGFCKISGWADVQVFVTSQKL